MTEKAQRIIRLSVFIVLLTFFLIFAAWRLWYGGIFSPRSAVVEPGHIILNGRNYVGTTGIYSEGRVVARGENDWVVEEVKEDPSHTFLVARSLLDQYLCVDETYPIPESGKISKAAWDEHYIEDTDFIDAISLIVEERVTSFTYITEAIFRKNDKQNMKELRVAYEDCPVASSALGWLGKINGQWVITTYESTDCRNEDGSLKAYEVGCYLIPDKFISVFESVAKRILLDPM